MRIHLSLRTRDLGQARSFYEGLFGQPPSKLRSDYFNYRLDSPPLHLAFSQAGAAEDIRSGAAHFGVELVDHEQLDRWTRRLADAGIAFREQPNASCCYAVGDKIWVSDPEGNEWEIWVRTGEGEQLHDRDAVCCAN